MAAEVFASDGKEEARWIEATQNACPACGGSGHKDDCAESLLDTVAEITRLRAELAEARESARSAHEVGFAAGIEAALAAAVDYTPEKHSGLTLASHVTGKNIQNAIRALTPPDITAAAARVLLAAWPTDTSFDAAFAACATAYHGGDQMQDTMDRTLATVSAALRALAEVKP